MHNILLISKEVLRKDYLSCYGGKTPTSNIDALAEKGTLFNNYYTAAPSTAMAITCMFSGLNAHELNRRTYTEVEQFEQTPTLFSILEDRQYETHVIWPEYLAKLSWKYSKVFDPRTVIHNLPGAATHILAINQAQRGQTAVTDASRDNSTHMLFYEEVDKILYRAKKPIFIWMHCPHVFNPRTCIGLDIDLLDELVGKIAKSFNGSIYLTADHGGLIGEKGKFGYGFDVYEGAVNIPLITPLITSKVINQPLSSIQLKTIILENQFYTQPYVYSDTQYYTQPDRKLMLRKGDFKYIYNKRSRKEELYDLTFDLHEDVNLLLEEVYEPDRKISYRLHEVYPYSRWKEAREAYIDLRGEKNRVWQSSSFLATCQWRLVDYVGRNLPARIKQSRPLMRFLRKLVKL